MKGKIILIPLKEPKEGMKVVVKGSKIGKLFKRAKNWSDAMFEIEGLTPHDTWQLSELQQIAVEYEAVEVLEERFIDNKYFPSSIKRTLPLHPDDYEKALPLIGKEVEFYHVYKVPDTEWTISYATPNSIEMAKLITPTPVMYTEEQAKMLFGEGVRRGQRAGLLHGNVWIDKWFNELKKK